MAKSIWTREEDLAAFQVGVDAAAKGYPRLPPAFLETYNEKAAFNDGWDTGSGWKPTIPAISRRTNR